MYYTTTDKLKLFYEYRTAPEATETIVLLNGLSQSTVAWALITPSLLKKYNVLLLDFIFQGQSDKNAEFRDFITHAADVKGLLDEIGVDAVSVVGLSYGSLVAQDFAILFPHRLNKLILMGTFAHKTPYFDAVSNAWQKALEIGGYSLMFEVMLPSVLGEDYFKNPLIPIDLMRQSRKDLNEDNTAILKLMRATNERKDYREALKQIKKPTLIIQGEKDLLLPVHLAKAVQECIEGSRLEIIPNAGHTLNIEAIPEVTRLITAFI